MQKEAEYREIFLTNRWQTRGILKTQARKVVDAGFWCLRNHHYYPDEDCFLTLEAAKADVEQRLEQKLASVKRQLARLERYEMKVKDL